MPDDGCSGSGNQLVCTEGASSDQRYPRAGRPPEEADLRFRDLLESIDLIAVILDQRGYLTFCNEFLLKLTAWRREDVIGRDWCDLFVPPNQYTRQLFISQLVERRIPARHENEIFTRDGARRLISWNNIIRFDASGNPIGTASIGQDVTESRQLEEALRSSEEKFRQIAESVHEVFGMMNAAADEIIYVNPAYETIWGRKLPKPIPGSDVLG